MGEYIRYTALALMGLVLVLVVGKQGKDFSLLLTLAVCALLCMGVMEFLEPVTQFLAQLRRLGKLDSQAVEILLKAAGVGLVGELAANLCADAGEAAVGKVLHILTNAAILWLSLPLFQQILTLIEEVLSGI